MYVCSLVFEGISATSDSGAIDHSYSAKLALKMTWIIYHLTHRDLYHIVPFLVREKAKKKKRKMYYICIKKENVYIYIYMVHIYVSETI